MSQTSLYVIFLYSLFMLFAGILIYNFKDIIGLIETMPRQAKILFFFISVMAMVIRFGVVSHTVLFDEPMYLNVAQNMYYHHQYGGTLQGTKDSPENIGFYNRPGGHPFLINLCYLFFGETERSAFFLNSLLGALSIAVIFLFVYALFESGAVAFFAGFVMNFLPIHLVCSSSIASEISAFFYVALALLALVLFNKHHKIGMLYLFSSAAVFSFYIRPELTLLLFPLIAYFVYLMREQRVARNKVVDQIFFVVMLVLPLFKQFVSMGEMETAGFGGPFWSVPFFWEHLGDNLKYLGDNTFTPVLYPALCLFGVISLYDNNRRILVFLLMWLIVFLFVYSGYALGNFCGSPRYSFVLILPVAVLSGLGLKYCVDKFRGVARVFVCAFLLMALVMTSFASTQRLYGLVRDAGLGQEHSFLKAYGPQLPDTEYIVTLETYFVVAELNKKALAIGEWRKAKDSYDKLLLLKTINWREELFAQDEVALRKSYDFRMIIERTFAPGSRTIIAELTKKRDRR